MPALGVLTAAPARAANDALAPSPLIRAVVVSVDRSKARLADCSPLKLT
ncbi:hypothetical protein KKP04_03225 [Rhodomicrobium sp. Az07]|nr:hypothetical protein [Rhodomicrobium sp. Az07]MBT3069878.1 hypothetical protein [Rhodomicrobium sp. Az07]